MSDGAEEEYVVTERAAIITRELMLGHALTVHDVAQLTGLSWDGASKLLARLCRVLNLYRDETGRWFLTTG
jgi:hypothetical protein